jgi:hypothetical protein
MPSQWGGSYRDLPSVPPPMSAGTSGPRLASATFLSGNVGRTVLAVETLASGVLAGYRLGAKGFWFDEIGSVPIALLPLRSLADSLLHANAVMALYLVASHYWVGLGTNEASVRLLSVAAATATVPLTCLMVDQLFGRGTALLAGGLLLTTPSLLRMHRKRAAMPSSS